MGHLALVLILASELSLYAGAGPGAVDGGGPAGIGSLTLVWSPTGILAAELLGDAGGTTTELWQRLALGARIEKRGRRTRPFASLRLTHIHMAPYEVWVTNPGQAFAGGSEIGVEHRSGLSAAVGVSTVVPRTRERARMFISGEMMWVPVGSGPQWFPIVQAGFGYRFR